MKIGNTLLLSFVFFILGFNLVLPFYNKSIVSSDPVGTPYDYWYAPENSFGVSSTKTVNWTYFKQLFNDHTNFYLHYKQTGTSDWILGNQYMDISKDWLDELNGWKMNFTFSKPYTQNNIDVRFTFNCDLVVLDYVYKEDNFVYFLNYTVPGTDEVYYVYFNWSDLNQYNGLLLNKLFIDDQFYFTIQKSDISNDFVGDIVLDPVFGYDDSYIQPIFFFHRTSGTEYFKLVNGTTGGTGGTADNVTFWCDDNVPSAGINVSCFIYEYVDYSSSYAGDLVGQTEVYELTTSDKDSLITLSFSDPKPSLSGSTDYYVGVGIIGNYPSGYSDDGLTLGGHTSTGTASPLYKNSAGGVTYDDPLTGEYANTYRTYVYCSYTEDSGLTLNLVDTYTCDFGNDTLELQLVDTYTCDFGNDSYVLNLVDTYNCDFGNDTIELQLIDTYTADFGNDTLELQLVDTYTCDFGNVTGIVLVDTYTCDFGNDTGDGILTLVDIYTCDFGNENLTGANESQIYDFLVGLGFINEGEDMNIGLEESFMMLIFWLILVWIELKVPRNYIGVCFIFGILQFFIPIIAYINSYYDTIFLYWAFASFGLLYLGFYKTYKGVGALEDDE